MPRSIVVILFCAGCVGVSRDEALNDRLRERPAKQCAGEPLLYARSVSEIAVEELFGLPAVTARVGDHPVTFLIDTGSEFCLLRPGLIEELHLPVAGRTTLSLLGETGETLTTCVHDMSLGDIRCRHLPFVVSPGHLERHILGVTIERLDGVLGMTFLRAFATAIDLPNGLVRFTLADDYDPPVGPGVCGVPLTILPDGRPCVAVTLHDGKNHPFLLDTGARRCVIRQELARRIGLPDKGEVRLASLGVEVDAYLTELPEVRFTNTPRDVVLKNHPAYVLPRARSGMLRHVDGLIGMELFQQFVVTIDPKNRRLILEERK